MKQLNLSISLVALLNIAFACNGQSANQSSDKTSANSSAPVGGGCDGCEIMYIGMPASINSTDTSAGWYEKGQKLLLTGTVYKKGGRIPIKQC
jgi:protocatechuate 3,4-dioxygenase, beta subunit